MQKYEYSARWQKCANKDRVEGGGEKYRWGYGTWDIGKTKSDVEKIMSDVEKTTSDIIFALAGF